MGQNDGLSVVFGEVLFDCFDDREVLGGAPLNFAWHLRQFGRRTAMVSAVGNDRLGGEVRGFLTRADIVQDWVTDRPEATGTVTVSLHDGEPTYTIHRNVAWDHIQSPDPLPGEPDLVYFGTVAQRDAGNRETLRQLLATAPRHRLCDVNLRPPFYSEEIVLESLRQATIVKLNEEEWPIVQRMVGLNAPAELLELFDLEMIALTRGGAGAELYLAEGKHNETGQPVAVVDTIGAGDAFCAALAAGVLADADPGRILSVACSAGTAAVRQRGGQGRLPNEVTAAYERGNPE